MSEAPYQKSSDPLATQRKAIQLAPTKDRNVDVLSVLFDDGSIWFLYPHDNTWKQILGDS